MFITVDLLKQHDACKGGIKFFERFYPNGAEAVEVMSRRHVNKEFLHWARDKFEPNDEELRVYCEVCKIVDSKDFWHSEEIEDSERIVKSKKIKNSQGVFNSKEIERSNDVVESEEVTDSFQIFYSGLIDSSEKVFGSKNITNSINVYLSTLVIRSNNVLDSFNVFDSTEIIKSKFVSNSHFCQNCSNIKHCMFCSDLSDAEYYLFNVPIAKEHYELFEKQYLKYFNELLMFSQAWPEKLLARVEKIELQPFSEWYKSIPEKFWKWVRTLPNFDSLLIYDITMLPEILIDQQ